MADKKKISQWELSVALGMLGLDDTQKQIVVDAIPLAAKLIDHVAANKQLFATIFADAQLLTPAAKIVMDALAAKGYTMQSFANALRSVQ